MTTAKATSPFRARGADHPRAKLSDEQIAELRERRERLREPQKVLAHIYGVSQSHVSHILARTRRSIR